MGAGAGDGGDTGVSGVVGVTGETGAKPPENGGVAGGIGCETGEDPPVLGVDGA